MPRHTHQSRPIYLPEPSTEFSPGSWRDEPRCHPFDADPLAGRASLLGREMRLLAHATEPSGLIKCYEDLVGGVRGQLQGRGAFGHMVADYDSRSGGNVSGESVGSDPERDSMGS
jgi:hypothetical protein